MFATRISRFRVLILVSLCIAGIACSNSKEDQAKRASGSSTAHEQEDTPRSARGTGAVHRNLLDEVGRAELRSGGLIINLGTSDQHKYTRGGWKTGWSVSESRSPSAATTGWSRAVLDVLLDERPAELVLRARSVSGSHSITPYLGSTALGKGTVKGEWQTLRFAMPAELRPGSHTISFRFSTSGQTHTEVDWIYLANSEGATLPPIEPLALPVTIGDAPKRALVSPSSRSYSFYLEPAEGERLVVDVASEVGATFEIRAHADGAKPKVLWSGTGTETWQEVVADLSELAGHAVRLELKTKGREGVSAWGEPVLMRASEGTAEIDAGDPAQNVVYILIDTARADAFWPGSKIKTPSYDALAAESTRFLNAYNNENWTKPSVATVLSGVYPSTHGTKRDESAFPRKLELISERLHKHGFATAGFVANGYVSNKFGFDKGWDEFTNYIREGKRSDAEHLYGDALEWLEQHRQKSPSKRYFLYLQAIDPHVAYDVAEPYWRPYFDGHYDGPLGRSVDAKEQNALTRKKGSFDRRERDWLAALYSGEISYHDEHMGKFLAAARAAGYLDDTAIIISNDHGEELGDRNGFGHGHSLYEELIRSPLLVHYPPLFGGGKVVTDIVEHVDLVPTLLDLLGLEPSPIAEGESLLPLASGEPVSRPRYAITEFLDGRRAVRVGRYKMMRSSGDNLRIFDLESDVGEKKDLARTAPIARRLCETHLGEGLAVPTKSRRQQDLVARQRFEAGKAEISESMRRKFEALGYFGARPDPVE